MDKNNWYKFDDSKVEKFDVKNLGEECYGGYGGMKKDDQKKLNSAYFLVYELSKKKPIKIALNENEINKIKIENNINIEKVNKENEEKIEKEYDVSKLNNPFDEKELLNKVFYNTDEKEYYKYVSYDNIPKNINNIYMMKE